jgi:hypothetical protein
MFMHWSCVSMFIACIGYVSYVYIREYPFASL